MTIEERERKKEGITKLLNVKKKQHSEKKKKSRGILFWNCFGFLCLFMFGFFFLFFVLFFYVLWSRVVAVMAVEATVGGTNPTPVSG